MKQAARRREEDLKIEKEGGSSIVSDRAWGQSWVESLWSVSWEREKESKRHWES